MEAERRWAAMGSDAHVVVVGPARGVAGLLDHAQARVEELEARWSRFRADSEVRRLDAARGTTVAVSPDTELLVRRAVDAWWLSAGLVDCTVLDAVVAAGYDAPLAALAADRPAPPIPRAWAGPGTTGIVVGGGAVRLPATCGFDPGGIGKGLAADLVSAELVDAGAEGVCVNLGGDLRVRGRGPCGPGWTIAVEHPHGGGPLALLGLADGGVATSTTLRRSWRVGGETRHHLIDPRTGRPSTTDLALVGAVAGEAWEAEALAKAVLLRGGAHRFDLVDGTGAAALAVGRDGVVSASPGLQRFLGGVPLPDHVPLPDRAREVAR